MPLEYAHVNSTVTNQLPVLYTTRHLPGRNRISNININRINDQVVVLVDGTYMGKSQLGPLFGSRFSG